MNWPSGLGFTAADAAALGPTLAVVFGFIVTWMAMCAVTGWLAGRKNRGSGLWFVLAFFSGPIALLAICLLKPAPRTDYPDTDLWREIKAREPRQSPGDRSRTEPGP